MYTLTVNNINDLLYEACKLVKNEGNKVVVRDYETKEVRPVMIEITNPLYRTLFYPYRGNNPFQTLFETIWVLASENNNIEHLSKFLPRAKDYSDDGKTWRAGYPERLKFYGVDKYKVNQIKYVYEKLKQDPETRQAIIVLWNPILDDFNILEGRPNELIKSRDFSCSQLLNFIIRKGELHLTFYIRSNDAVFGLSSINFYEFSTLQEILAGLLNVKIGKFHYIINSLHVYERHYEKMNKIIDEYLTYYRESKEFYRQPIFKFYPDNIDISYDDYFNCLDILHKTIINDNIKTFDDSLCPVDGLYNQFSDIFYLCKLYLKYKYITTIDNDILNMYFEDLKKINISDLKVVCHYWFLKKFKIIKTYELNKAIKSCIHHCLV